MLQQGELICDDVRYSRRAGPHYSLRSTTASGVNLIIHRGKTRITPEDLASETLLIYPAAADRLFLFHSRQSPSVPIHLLLLIRDNVNDGYALPPTGRVLNAVVCVTKTGEGLWS